MAEQKQNVENVKNNGITLIALVITRVRLKEQRQGF